MRTLPNISIPDHLHEFLKKKRFENESSYAELVRDALQKEYDRNERIKKRAKQRND